MFFQHKNNITNQKKKQKNKRKNILQRIILNTISFILITEQPLFAALTGLDIHSRSFNPVKQITQDSNISDLPVASIQDSFSKISINFNDPMDLSKYIGKKVFVGYGIYDSGEKNCKFIEQPGVSRVQYETNFAFWETFNNHTYAISKTPMDYASCKKIANTLGGYPVVPDNSAENAYLASRFTNIDIDNKHHVNDIWLGIYKTNCSDIYYSKENSGNQVYYNWDNSVRGQTCVPGKLNAILQNNLKWNKVSSSENHYCLVEFDSPDIYRPLKICAPWWKVIREYKNPNESSIYNIRELERINQFDVPIHMNICTKYQDGTYEEEKEKKDRIIECRKYYSVNAAPECARDIHQPQCYVSECAGYVENACTLIDSDLVGKGYVKGEIVVDGLLKEVKIKDDDRIFKYKCPPSTISVHKCVETSDVSVEPQECPGSDCEGLKKCIYSISTALKPDEYDAEMQKCMDSHKCEKIYPNLDIPPTLNSNNEVVYLHGKCSDGTILNFVPNIISKKGKKCLEYEEVNQTTKAVEKCVLNRKSHRVTVHLALGDIDTYENNESCLRLDNVVDRFDSDIYSLKVQGKNYFIPSIKQVYLDGTVNTLASYGDGTWMFDNSMPQTKADISVSQQVPDSFNNNVKVETIDESKKSNLDCSAYEDNSVLDKMYALFLDNSSDRNSASGSDTITIDGWIETIDNSGYGYVNVPQRFLDEPYKEYNSTTGEYTEKVDGERRCKEFASDHGFSSYLNSYDYSEDKVTGVKTCKLKLNLVGFENELSSVQIVSDSTSDSGSALIYTFKNNMNKKDCLDKAICLDGTYNEGDFPTDSSTAKCIVRVNGDGFPSEYEDEYADLHNIKTPDNNTTGPSSSEEAAAFDSDGFLKKDAVLPVGYSRTVTVNFSGLQSILIIEEKLPGGFGFASNWMMWPPLVDKFAISDGSNNYALYLPEMSMINDYVEYHGIYDHGSYRKKKPNVIVSLMMGATGGLAAFYLFSLAVGWSIGIGIVIVVILLLLTRPKKMDSQDIEWHYFKDLKKNYYYPGLYETRKNQSDSDAAISGERSSHQSSDSNFVRMTYWHEISKTGRYKPGKFLEILKELYKHKYNVLVSIGFSNAAINNTTDPDETGIHYGYPKCKWYNPWCEKSDHHTHDTVSNNIPAEIPSSVVYPSIPHYYGSVRNIYPAPKLTTSYYMGAINSLVIVVPYIGDYEIEAYDKYNNLLAKRTIRKSDFGGVTSAGGLKYSQVNFGQVMGLADGIVEGTNSNACRYDRAVEWGGGVSGVFEESQRTDFSVGCQKSNDNYVKEHSMRKIVIKPLNSKDQKYVYNLTAPMPYPNRIWIETLNKKETRNYICYDNFGKCADTDFKPSE